MNTPASKTLSSKLLSLHQSRRAMTNTAIIAVGTVSAQGNIQTSSASTVKCKTSSAPSSMQNRSFATALSPQIASENWSHTLNYASPESDFSSSSSPVRQYSDNHQYSGPPPTSDDDDEEYKALRERYMQYLESSENAPQRGSLAYSLSLATPESDSTSPFITPFLSEMMKEQLEISNHQLVMEKDGAAKEVDREYRELQERYLDFLQSDENSEHRESLAYSLSLASPESDFTSPHITPMLSETMKAQLENSTNQLLAIDTTAKKEVTEQKQLPRSYTQAIQNKSNDAIVITSKRHPYRIISVNDAWTKLCGYTQEESYGRTLKSLLHGPETNGDDIGNVMFKLVEENEESEMTLVNYTKEGRKFVNHVRVGPLVDEESGEITHFVGLLSEVMREKEMKTAA